MPERSGDGRFAVNVDRRVLSQDEKKGGGSRTKGGAKEIPSLNLQVLSKASGFCDSKWSVLDQLLVGSYRGPLGIYGK